LDTEEKKLYIKLAYGYYQNKEFKKALDLYEKIYESDADDFNVLNMLADTYLKLNMREKSIEAYVLSVFILERKEQFDKIIKLSKKILRNFPDEQRVKNKLKNAIRIVMNGAEKKITNHEYSEARAIYENLQEFNGDEYPINQKIKELNDEEAAFTARSRKQEEIKRDVPQDTQKDLLSKFDKMAQNYLNNGDFDGAVETYITALKLSPGNEDLRAKLHKVYMTIAQGATGEKVWDKLNSNPKDKLEEAKQKALEERHAQIMKDEEARARQMLEEEAKIQNEYEAQELVIIQAAAEELKAKLDEAQKSAKLKEEEVQRIMKEQEEKKRELLEKLKREAIDKFKKQKDAIHAQVAAAKSEAEAKEQENGIFEAKQVSSASLMENLKKAYEVPRVGQEPGKEEVSQAMQELAKDIPVAKAPEKTAEPAVIDELPAIEKVKDEITDDIGEVEHAPKSAGEEIIVNDETLDSLITMAFIYINQGVIKEAMRIYNKLSEKYQDNKEVKGLLDEITKRHGS
jgi:tetratricopeptide (TPR) repeat protein